MHRYLPLAAACALLLAGCASDHGLASQGRLRDASTLAATKSLGQDAGTTAAWPDARWWSRYGDSQLDALVEESLAASPTLEVANARTRKAIAQAGLADAARRPSVAAGAQVLGMQIPESLAGPDIGGDFNIAELLTLTLHYDPDFWGADEDRWQAALGNARAAEVGAQAARLALIANIARTYVALAQAFDAQDAAEAESTRAEALVALERQRVRAGLDNAIALDQDRSAAAGARQQVLAARQRIDALRNALAALAGAGPDRGLAIRRPGLATAAAAVPPLLPSDLLARRADIVAARWRVDAARHGIDASKAAFYPTINLSAMVGLAAGNLGDLFGSDALLVNGGPALSLPIFDGGRLRNQLLGSQADYDLAVGHYNQALLDAIREVADAAQAARALDAQLADVRVARDAAAHAHALVLQRHRAGLASRLDVLEAQKPLLQFDQQLAALLAQRRTAGIDLDQALGGGIVAAAPAPISLHGQESSP